MYRIDVDMNSSLLAVNGTTSVSFGLYRNVTSDPLAITVLTYIDYVNRCFSTLTHIGYFTFVSLTKEQRTSTLAYVHHANVIGFVFVLIYMGYFTSKQPDTGNKAVDLVLCTCTELAWAHLKYMRAYSLVIIAFHRLLAISRPRLFQRVNGSLLLILLPILFAWLLTITLVLTTKFAFATTHGSPFCIDGYSADVSLTVGYLAISSSLCILLPCGVIIPINLYIRHKIAENRRKVRPANLRQQNQEPSLEDEVTNVRRGNDRNRNNDNNVDERLNNQIIAMNVVYLCCFSASFVLSFRYIIVNFNEKFYYLRQILRIANIAGQGLIPLISLYFNPSFTVNKLVTFIKEKTRTGNSSK